MSAAEAVQIVVLNGGSSAGKSSIAVALQNQLAEPWLSLSVDTLLDAMPVRLTGADAGIQFGTDGSIELGEEFTALEDAWMAGVAAMVRAGARVIVQDGFVSGPAAQRRWRAALTGCRALWVAVRCAPAVAAAREAARSDRPPGMAREQAELVHRGIDYDLSVDTTATSAAGCAALIARELGC